MLMAQALGSLTSKMKKAFQLRHSRELSRLSPLQTAAATPSKNQPLMAANKPKRRRCNNAMASFRLRTLFFGRGNNSF